MTLRIELVQAPTEEARALIEELEAELSQDYSKNQRHGLSLARVFQPGVLFFVARLDDDAVGCGGMAIQENEAELKRMFVRPAKRGVALAKPF
jgi:putative acetyltransferase